ncbi:MAG TPA: WGR domain-containing protein, partial [Polyangiaceae bacterium]|nr:WGR domain-containing protein [Polyangiaceae bacterium]
MRRFEFSEGNSNKFWQVEQKGESLLIQWGKIGTNGQSQTKDFTNDAKAKSEADKLIAEKKKKGYVEVKDVAPAGTASTRAPAIASSAPSAAAMPTASNANASAAASKKEPAPRDRTAQSKDQADGEGIPSGTEGRAADESAPTPAPSKESSLDQAFKPHPVVVLQDEHRAERDTWRDLTAEEIPSASDLLSSLHAFIVKQRKDDKAWSEGKNHADAHGKAVADYALESYAKGKVPTKPDAALDGAFTALVRTTFTMRLFALWHGLEYALDAFVESFSNEWHHEYKSNAVSPAWVARCDPATNWAPFAGSGEKRIQSLAGVVDAAEASARNGAHAHAEKLRRSAALPARVGLSLVFADTKWAAQDALEVLALKDQDIYAGRELLYLLRERRLLDAFPTPEYGRHPISLLVNAGLECVGVLIAWLDNQYSRDEAARALSCVERVESARALVTVLDKKD